MTVDLKWLGALGGIAAGYLSLLRLLWGDIRAWSQKPRLKIEFDSVEDLREWGLLGTGRQQKVATVHVRNRRRTTATRCVAVLRLVSTPPNVTIHQKEFTLHWADTVYTANTSIAEPVEIGQERRRLDVAFTYTQNLDSPAGAWVAIPLALSAPGSAAQAYLPPGAYRFHLSVGCENGKGSSQDFAIDSPPSWRALSMRPVDC